MGRQVFHTDILLDFIFTCKLQQTYCFGAKPAFHNFESSWGKSNQVTELYLLRQAFHSYVPTHISWNQFERDVNVFLLRQGTYHSLIPGGGFTVGTALTGFTCPMGIQEDSIPLMLTEQFFRALTSDHIYQCGLSSAMTLRQWTKLLGGSGRNCMMSWRIFYFVLLLINPQSENPLQRKRQKQEEEALLIMGVRQNQLPSWLNTLHFSQASPFI